MFVVPSHTFDSNIKNKLLLEGLSLTPKLSIPAKKMAPTRLAKMDGIFFEIFFLAEALLKNKQKNRTEKRKKSFYYIKTGVQRGKKKKTTTPHKQFLSNHKTCRVQRRVHVKL